MKLSETISEIIDSDCSRVVWVVTTSGTPPGERSSGEKKHYVNGHEYPTPTITS